VNIETRYGQCPKCKMGGEVDLSVFGMCLFCTQAEWDHREKKRRGYSRKQALTACAYPQTDDARGLVLTRQ